MKTPWKGDRLTNQSALTRGLASQNQVKRREPPECADSKLPTLDLNGVQKMHWRGVKRNVNCFNTRERIDESFKREKQKKQLESVQDWDLQEKRVGSGHGRWGSEVDS